jgi:hypothetical protein
MRTTIDIDDPILKDLKRLQLQEGKSLGRLVSDLLAVALNDAPFGQHTASKPGLEWHSKAMNAKVDLSDKHALLDAMDRREL